MSVSDNFDHTNWVFEALFPSWCVMEKVHSSPVKTFSVTESICNTLFAPSAVLFLFKNMPVMKVEM